MYMFVAYGGGSQSGGSVYQSEVGGKEFSARVNVSGAHQNNTLHPPTS